MNEMPEPADSASPQQKPPADLQEFNENPADKPPKAEPSDIYEVDPNATVPREVINKQRNLDSAAGEPWWVQAAKDYAKDNEATSQRDDIWRQVEARTASDPDYMRAPSAEAVDAKEYQEVAEEVGETAIEAAEEDFDPDATIPRAKLDAIRQQSQADQEPPKSDESSSSQIVKMTNDVIAGDGTEYQAPIPKPETPDEPKDEYQMSRALDAVNSKERLKAAQIFRDEATLTEVMRSTSDPEIRDAITEVRRAQREIAQINAGEKIWNDNIAPNLGEISVDTTEIRSLVDTVANAQRDIRERVDAAYQAIEYDKVEARDKITAIQEAQIADLAQAVEGLFSNDSLRNYKRAMDKFLENTDRKLRDAAQGGKDATDTAMMVNIAGRAMSSNPNASLGNIAESADQQLAQARAEAPEWPNHKIAVREVVNRANFMKHLDQEKIEFRRVIDTLEEVVREATRARLSEEDIAYLRSRLSLADGILADMQRFVVQEINFQQNPNPKTEDK